MAQLSVSGPFDKRYLHNDLGTNPMCAHSRQASALGKRRPGLFDLVEPTPQIEQELGIESGADLAGKEQVASFKVADEQRAEANASALRIGVAADHQLLRRLAFHF